MFIWVYAAVTLHYKIETLFTADEEDTLLSSMKDLKYRCYTVEEKYFWKLFIVLLTIFFLLKKN